MVDREFGYIGFFLENCFFDFSFLFVCYVFMCLKNLLHVFGAFFWTPDLSRTNLDRLSANFLNDRLVSPTFVI